MSCVSAQRRCRSLLLALLGCALLLDAASAQEIQLITVAGQKQMLSKPGTDPVGARHPDVTIVEYFDYNCPYCKQLVPALHTLIEQDPQLAIVYKDWPILGPVSQYAAASALAAGYQGKYLAAHDALMGGPRLGRNEQVDALLKAAGVNMDTLKEDRTRHAGQIAALLARNDAEAHALSLDGTPGLVIGLQLVPGIAGLSDLKRLVANSRHEK
jgi:protein-disulfide isomerase